MQHLDLLPSHFGDLTNLRHLDSSECRNLSSLSNCFGNLRNLRYLDLSGCRNLSSLPRNFGKITKLGHLNLSQCRNLSSLPICFCDLTNLYHLDLGSCTNLSSLPIRFGELKNLEHLDLSSCHELRSLPVSFKHLTRLQYLSLCGCSKLTIESEKLGILENMAELKYLNLSHCTQLEELPHIANETSWRELFLDGTSLRELPTNIDQLSKLRSMEIGNELFTSLPTSLGNLSSLTRLQISCCSRLEYLPDSLGNLNLLRDLKILRSGVKSLPKSFTLNLQRLEISNSPISELSFGPGCKLKQISLHSTEVSEVSISADTCPFLETLQLKYNHYLRELKIFSIKVNTIEVDYCTVLKNIRGVGGLLYLQKLIIKDCPDLDRLPDFANSTCLEDFQLQGCHKVVKIEGLEQLQYLETLKLYDCRMLKDISGIGELVNLRSLKISGCQELDVLPSFSELSSLKQIKLKDCHKVEKIDGLEHLKSLKKLKAYTCWKMPCTVNLEHTERLKQLVLVANEGSVIEPCIRMIQPQEWPCEVIICSRLARNVGPFVNSFAFPNLSVVDSFSMAKIGSCGELNLRQKDSSNAILICLIINCLSPRTHLIIRSSGRFEMEIAEGKWVWMGFFSQGSKWHGEDEYNIYSLGDSDSKVEKAWLVTGDQGRLVEAFHRVFNTFTRGIVVADAPQQTMHRQLVACLLPLCTLFGLRWRLHEHSDELID